MTALAIYTPAKASARKREALGHQFDDLGPVNPLQWIAVKPIHCHQRQVENTLITKLRVLTEGRLMIEAVCKIKPEELKFFFDHHIDHIPGMVQVNTFRQAALAFAHIVYGAPMDYVALLDWLGVRLLNYGELGVPTMLRFKLIGAKKTSHRLELTWDGLLIQKDCPIMSAKGKCVMLSPLLGQETRYRKKKVHLSSGFLSDEWFPHIKVDDSKASFHS